MRRGSKNRLEYRVANRGMADLVLNVYRSAKDGDWHECYSHIAISEFKNDKAAIKKCIEEVRNMLNNPRSEFKGNIRELDSVAKKLKVASSYEDFNPELLATAISSELKKAGIHKVKVEGDRATVEYEFRPNVIDYINCKSKDDDTIELEVDANGSGEPDAVDQILSKLNKKRFESYKGNELGWRKEVVKIVVPVIHEAVAKAKSMKTANIINKVASIKPDMNLVIGRRVRGGTFQDDMDEVIANLAYYKNMIEHEIRDLSQIGEGDHEIATCINELKKICTLLDGENKKLLKIVSTEDNKGIKL